MIGPWARRVLPSHFLILGGEPTLNPDLAEIVVATREMWPGDPPKLMVVTNGFFLHKHVRLADALKSANCFLDISIHHNAPEYLAELDKAKEWANTSGLGKLLRFRPSFEDWLEYYRGEREAARPFEDQNPQSSWDHCPSRWCMTIRDGKLYKCPMAAWVPMHVAKFGDGDGKWTPYLSYRPLSPDCSDDEMNEFIRRRVESCCSMCPADPKPLLKMLPMRSKK
jgi:hypothetical protein